MAEINIPKEFNQRSFVKVVSSDSLSDFNKDLENELRSLYSRDYVVLNIEVKQPVEVNSGYAQYNYELYMGVIIYAQK